MGMKFRFQFIAILVVLVMASMGFTWAIYGEVNRYEEELRKSHSMDEIALSIFQKRFLVDDYLLSGTERSREQWLIKQKTINQLLASPQLVFRDPEEEILANRMFSSVLESQEVIDQITPELSPDKKSRLAAQLTTLSQAAISTASRLSDASAKRAQTAFGNMIWIASGALALFLCLLFASLRMIWRIFFQLDEAKAKDEALLQSMGDGVIAADPSFHILVYNTAAELMLGWNAKDMLGKKLKMAIPRIEDEMGNLIPEAERPAALALKTQKKVETDGTSRKTLYYVKNDKTRFPVAITATPVLLREKIIGIILVFRDITREKELDKAKSEFISLASHQLKTPPVAIRWATEGLLRDSGKKLDKDQREQVKVIHDVNQKMMETIDSLLDVSRLELGTFVVNPEPTDYRRVSDEVLRELEPDIRSAHLKVVKEFDRTLPKIPADPGLGKIIVQNLLTNAVKYTPKNGRITVRVTAAEKNKKEGVLIEVEDTGCGIPKSQQSKIFTKMFRAGNVGKIDGSGFGLYLLKSIVDLGGGEIEFVSEEGKGSTFSVHLPLAGMRRKKGTSQLFQKISTIAPPTSKGRLDR